MPLSNSYIRLSENASIAGFRVITLENEILRIDIVPALGAKIVNFIHKPTDTNFLWHNPHVELRAVSAGASYDDNFVGGWDELFPNDSPGIAGGTEPYPDHGELWSQSWSYDVTQNAADCVEVHLQLRTTVTNCLVEKWISLRPADGRLRFRHRITNQADKPLDFLWKLHPAVVVEQGDRIDVPGSTGEAVDPTFGSIRAQTPFPWPVYVNPGGTPLDVSRVPPINNDREFVYVRGLTAGWCAVRRVHRNVGFGLVFPTHIFSSVWLFMTFGGWRGLSTVVLEPCTAVPKDLREAIRLGTCSHLEPHESMDAEVMAVAFGDTMRFRRIAEDGTVEYSESYGN